MKYYPKSFKIGLVVLAFIIVVFFVLQAFSFSLSLILSGLNPAATHVLAPRGSLGLGNKQFAVICTTTSHGNYALVQLSKSTFGFWVIENTQVLTEDHSYQNIFWVEKGSSQVFYEALTPDRTQTETHCAIIGNNAQKRIELDLDALPDGFYFTINQVDNFYIIHIMEQSGLSFNYNSIYNILKNNGSVS